MSVDRNGAASRQHFLPFPSASSTLIVAPPYTGKTYFVKQVLEAQELYFERPISNVIVINCDERVKFYELQDRPVRPDEESRPLPQVEQFVWETFDSEALKEGDVVVIDDLQVITPRVRELITALAHHCCLGHLFVICHGVLGTRMYELLSYVHRVCLFTASTAVVRLGLYVIQRFFVDAELKDFLKRVLGICERQQEILILEINNLPGNVQPYHVALSHLTRLRNPEAPFAMAYSYPSKSGLYEQLARQKRIAKVAPELLKALPQKDFLPQGSFLILDPASVEKLREEEEEKEESRNRDYEDATVEDCVEKQTAEWDETVAELETRIEDFIDPKGGKWLLAKNLLKEILRNSNICILENRKEMMLNDIYSTRVSILDFITNAIRRAGPSERETRANSAEYRLYRTYVQALLKNLCPKSIFKNNLLLMGRTLSPGSDRKSKKYKKSHKEKYRKRKKKEKRKTRPKYYATSDYDACDNEDMDEEHSRRCRRRKHATEAGPEEVPRKSFRPFLFPSN